jgi:hypothetical protein
VAVPVVIGIGLAVTSCSSAPGTAESAASAARSASVPVPQGYTRIGGAAQGISIAAPASWVALNLTAGSIESSVSKLGLSGVSASEVAQDAAAVQKLHGVIVFDVKSGMDSPNRPTPNLDASCGASGVTDVGASGVPLIKTSEAAEIAKLGATHITQQELAVGGVPGVETSYQFNSSSEGTIYGSQLEVLPAQNKVCLVTVTVVRGESEGSIMSTAAATAQFP